MSRRPRKPSRDILDDETPLSPPQVPRTPAQSLKTPGSKKVRRTQELFHLTMNSTLEPEEKPKAPKSARKDRPAKTFLPAIGDDVVKLDLQPPRRMLRAKRICKRLDSASDPAELECDKYFAFKEESGSPEPVQLLIAAKESEAQEEPVINGFSSAFLTKEGKLSSGRTDVDEFFWKCDNVKVEGGNEAGEGVKMKKEGRKSSVGSRELEGICADVGTEIEIECPDYVLDFTNEREKDAEAFKMPSVQASGRKPKMSIFSAFGVPKLDIEEHKELSDGSNSYHVQTRSASKSKISDGHLRSAEKPFKKRFFFNHTNSPEASAKTVDTSKDFSVLRCQSSPDEPPVALPKSPKTRRGTFELHNDSTAKTDGVSLCSSSVALPKSPKTRRGTFELHNDSTARTDGASSCSFSVALPKSPKMRRGTFELHNDSTATKTDGVALCNSLTQLIGEERRGTFDAVPTVTKKKRNTFDLQDTINDTSLLETVYKKDMKRVSILQRDVITVFDSSEEENLKVLDYSNVTRRRKSTDFDLADVSVPTFFDMLSEDENSKKRSASFAVTVASARKSAPKKRLSSTLPIVEAPKVLFQHTKLLASSTPVQKKSAGKNSALKTALLRGKANVSSGTNNSYGSLPGTSAAKKFPSSRKKVPNFAMLHQKAFERMESIDAYSSRKAERAKQLLAGKLPSTGKNKTGNDEPSKLAGKHRKQLTFAPGTVDEEKPAGYIALPTTPIPRKQPLEQIEASPRTPLRHLPQFRSVIPIKKPVTPKIKPNLLVLQKENKWIPKRSPLNLAASTIGATIVPGKFAPICVKAVAKVEKRPIVPIKDRPNVKAFAGKTANPTIAKSLTNKKRDMIRGVRSNRRFDLLMKMRQGN